MSSPRRSSVIANPAAHPWDVGENLLVFGDGHVLGRRLSLPLLGLFRKASPVLRIGSEPGRRCFAPRTLKASVDCGLVADEVGRMGPRTDRQSEGARDERCVPTVLRIVAGPGHLQLEARVTFSCTKATLLIASAIELTITSAPSLGT